MRVFRDAATGAIDGSGGSERGRAAGVGDVAGERNRSVRIDGDAGKRVAGKGDRDTVVRLHRVQHGQAHLRRIEDVALFRTVDVVEDAPERDVLRLTRIPVRLEAG